MKSKELLIMATIIILITASCEPYFPTIAEGEKPELIFFKRFTPTSAYIKGTFPANIDNNIHKGIFIDTVPYRVGMRLLEDYNQISSSNTYYWSSPMLDPQKTYYATIAYIKNDKIIFGNSITIPPLATDSLAPECDGLPNVPINTLRSNKYDYKVTTSISSSKKYFRIQDVVNYGGFTFRNPPKTGFYTLIQHGEADSNTVFLGIRGNNNFKEGDRIYVKVYTNPYRCEIQGCNITCYWTDADSKIFSFKFLFQ